MEEVWVCRRATGERPVSQAAQRCPPAGRSATLGPGTAHSPGGTPQRFFRRFKGTYSLGNYKYQFHRKGQDNGEGPLEAGPIATLANLTLPQAWRVPFTRSTLGLFSRMPIPTSRLRLSHPEVGKSLNVSHKTRMARGCPGAQTGQPASELARPSTGSQTAGCAAPGSRAGPEPR